MIPLFSLLHPLPPLFAGAPAPLAIGTAAKLRLLLILPDNAAPEQIEEARRALDQALFDYVTSPAYLEALTAPGAMRHDLDRNPQRPVSPAHAATARAILAGAIKPIPKHLKPKAPKPPQPEAIVVSVTVRTVKVAVMVPVEALTRIPLAPEGQPVGEVTLNLETPDGVKLAARLNGKSVRKGQKTAAENAGNVSVVLQGKLGSANRVLEAGLAVTPRTPREAA